MKAAVDPELCIGCGLCTSICPDVFFLNDEGLAEAVDQDIAEELLADAEEARDQCPVEAITIE